MIPQGAVSSYAVLQLKCILHGFFLISGILFGFAAGRGINFLQLGNGKGSLLGIFPGEAFVKIRQLRLSLLQLRYDKPHLQSPVSQVDVSDNLVACITGNSLDAFPDYR